MQKREEDIVRGLSLLLVLVIFAIYFSFDYTCLEVHRDSEMFRVLIYPFGHANIFHVLCNSWVFLTIVFYSRPTLNMLLTSFIATIIFGLACQSYGTAQGIVGLSGYIYALLGRYALVGTAKRNLRYNIIIVAFMTIGLALPNVSFSAHMVCYCLGILLSIILDKIY